MEHRTSSLPAACYALASGAKFLRCEALDATHCTFVFADAVAGSVDRYYADEPISPKRFFEAIRELRRITRITLAGGR